MEYIITGRNRSSSWWEFLSDQPGIHDKTFSQVPDERIKAARQLGALFEAFPDRKQAFEDLLRLCSDRDSEVREEAINSLKTVFPNVPEKELVWERFVNLTAYPVEQIMKAAVNALIVVFPLMSDKTRAWKNLVELINSKSSLEDVRRGIIDLLPDAISGFQDKEQAWKDLFEMRASDDPYIRERAISYLSMVFPGLPEEKKCEAWEDLLELAGEAGDIKIREHATEVLGEVFQFLPDEKKRKGWEEILQLADKNVDQGMQKEILLALASLFSAILDKKGAYDTVFRLTENERGTVQKQAADTLIKFFPYVPDKSQAYSDLSNLAEKKNSHMLREVVKTLASIHPLIYEKFAANKVIAETEKERWKKKEGVKSAEFYRPASEKDVFVRGDAFKFMGSAHSEEEKGKEKRIMGERKVSEEDQLESEQVKEKGGKKSAFDLLKLTGDRDRYVRKNAVESFARTYSGLPDKDEIIGELLRLSSDPDPQMRRGAIESLLAVYSRRSGKIQDIWRELLNMSEDADAGVRKGTAEMLSYVFPAAEEKSTVFSDLVMLTESQDAQLRKRAAELLAVAFRNSDDKQRAWNDLVRLTSSEDREVRKGAVLAISSGYPEVPDKAKVWSDLIRLSTHSDSFVQRAATRALGPAFFYVPDKTLAWRDLQVLANNPYIYARRYALRSLGRASLWRALKAENEAAYIFGLKEAVKYFKEAAETSIGTVIPEFYHPFYEALLQILFGERSSRLESERYLKEVTSELGGLEENRKILETLEEFAGFLRAAGDLTPGDLPVQKKLLESCIEAFDRASGLFEGVEEDYILAQKTFSKEYQKTGKVVVEQKLKETLSGIRYKARTACLKAKGKPAEKISCTISQKVREWSFEDIEKDRKKLERQLESLLNIVTVQIPYIPENTHIFEKLEEIRKEQDLLERYRLVGRIISMIPEVKMFSRASGR